MSSHRHLPLQPFFTTSFRWPINAWRRSTSGNAHRKRKQPRRPPLKSSKPHGRNVIVHAARISIPSDRKSNAVLRPKQRILRMRKFAPFYKCHNRFHRKIYSLVAMRTSLRFKVTLESHSPDRNEICFCLGHPTSTTTNGVSDGDMLNTWVQRSKQY